MRKKESVLVLGKGNTDIMRVFVQDPDENYPQGEYKLSERFEKVVTVDIDPGCKPDIVWNLEKLPWPFKSQGFSEVHAYDVLEHLSQPVDEVHAYEVLCLLGEVGNYKFFFKLWQQIWDVLKPGGLVCATTPWWESVWAWQDPGHKRVYSPELLCYLDQDEYTRQIGKTQMTDYRAFWPKPYSFKIRHAAMSGENPKNAGFMFVLQKEVKE